MMNTIRFDHEYYSDPVLLHKLSFLKPIILLLLFTVQYSLVIAQGTDQKRSQGEVMTLNQIIDLTLDQSISSLKAATIRENRYWQWKTYRSNYMPQLSIEGILPEFNRTINPVIQPDGSTIFQPVANNNSILNLSLKQGMSATGGEIFINSQLQRFDDFDRKFTSYNGNPAVIGIRQPLFAYNPLLWDKKIEPLRFEESRKTNTEDMEAISYFTSLYFFELLQAQINLEIAKKNLANNDTILKISNVKYELGKISKGDLLQLNLALKNSQKSVAQANLDYQTAILQLRTYTGIPFHENMSFKIPSEIPDFLIDDAVAISEAKKNRQKYISLKRTILEAERDVAKAKGDNGFNATLFATLGLTNRAESIPDIYQDVNNQQTVRIGFNLPIVDWERSASRIKTAQANHKLAQYTAMQDETIFTQEIHTQINQFKMLREQVKLTFEADELANERYKVFKNRFLIGELTFTDLNIAQQEKDQAKRDYIMTVRDFWLAYYNLRLLTLYDFELQQTIVFHTAK